MVVCRRHRHLYYSVRPSFDKRTKNRQPLQHDCRPSHVDDSLDSSRSAIVKSKRIGRGRRPPLSKRLLAGGRTGARLRSCGGGGSARKTRKPPLFESKTRDGANLHKQSITDGVLP